MERLQINGQRFRPVGIKIVAVFIARVTATRMLNGPDARDPRLLRSARKDATFNEIQLTTSKVVS